MCTKVWDSHSSHTSLNSNKDSVDCLDSSIEYNNPWRPKSNPIRRCNSLGKEDVCIVYPPLSGLNWDSLVEQHIWGKDASNCQQRVDHGVRFENTDDEGDDSGFEMLDYPPIKDFAEIMDKNQKVSTVRPGVATYFA